MRWVLSGLRAIPWAVSNVTGLGKCYYLNMTKTGRIREIFVPTPPCLFIIIKIFFSFYFSMISFHYIFSPDFRKTKHKVNILKFPQTNQRHSMMTHFLFINGRNTRILIIELIQTLNTYLFDPCGLHAHLTIQLIAKIHNKLS